MQLNLRRIINYDWSISYNCDYFHDFARSYYRSGLTVIAPSRGPLRIGSRRSDGAFVIFENLRFLEQHSTRVRDNRFILFRFEQTSLKKIKPIIPTPKCWEIITWDQPLCILSDDGSESLPPPPSLSRLTNERVSANILKANDALSCLVHPNQCFLYNVYTSGDTVPGVTSAEIEIPSIFEEASLIGSREMFTSSTKVRSDETTQSRDLIVIQPSHGEFQGLRRDANWLDSTKLNTDYYFNSARRLHSRDRVRDLNKYAIA